MNISKKELNELITLSEKIGKYNSKKILSNDLEKSHKYQEIETKLTDKRTHLLEKMGY